jgi:hypothetical protein
MTQDEKRNITEAIEPIGDAEPAGDSDRGAAGESADEQVPVLRPMTEPADDDDEAGEPYER